MEIFPIMKTLELFNIDERIFLNTRTFYILGYI